MKYLINMSFYEGDTLHDAGTLFEHSDKEYVEKLLADGNIVEASDSNMVPAENPTVSQPIDVAGTEATASPIPLEPSLPTQPSEPSLSEVANAAELENIPPSSDSTPPLATDIVLQ